MTRRFQHSGPWSSLNDVWSRRKPDSVVHTIILKDDRRFPPDRIGPGPLPHPERDDDNWFTFVEVKKGADGEPEIFRRPVPDYLFPIDVAERNAYNELRIEAEPRIGGH